LRIRLEEISLQEHAPKETENAHLRQLLEELQALTHKCNKKLTEAEAQIAELKRELFGPKADRLTPEQQKQLSKLNKDLEAEAQRPAAASDEVLDDEEDQKKKKRSRTTRRRGERYPLPAHLETETVTIEPEIAACP
jgi:exonuclease VII large subunit